MQAKPMRGESAKHVAIHALRPAGTPLHATAIALRVTGCARLTGKTPEATIAAMLAADRGKRNKQATGAKPRASSKRAAL